MKKEILTEQIFTLKKSLQDANFYNARLRSIQISKILPIIDQAYMIKKQKQERETEIFVDCFKYRFHYSIPLLSIIFLNK